MRALAESENAKDASKMLDAYKESLEDADQDDPDTDEQREKDRKARQQRRLDDAVAPTKGSGPSRREQTPDAEDAFEEGFYGNRERAR